MSADLIRSHARSNIRVRVASIAIAASLAAAVSVILALPAQAQTPATIIGAAQANAAAAAAAATAASAAQAGATPALPAAPVRAAVVGTSTPAKATLRNAPTIDALDRAQRAHFEAEVAKSIEDATRPPVVEPTAASIAAAAAATAAAAAPQVTVVAVPRYVAPPVDTTKTLLAIYGPVGREVADIMLPSGEVVTASVGWTYQGYRLVRVESGAIEISAPAPKGLRARSGKSGVSASQRRQYASTKSSSISSNQSAANSTDILVHVAVGGTFK